jgi:excinuclease ABC subunit A
LHINDIQRLVKVFRQLVDAGHSLVVIEHNLDVLIQADTILDIGPDGGDIGGEVVAQGSVQEICLVKKSITAKYLKQRLSGK